MRMTLLQVASTSLRMCVESKIGVLMPELADQLVRRANLRRVEAGRRLVKDQHRRIGKQGVGQADALAIALREGADDLPADIFDPAALEDVVRRRWRRWLP